MPESGRSVVAQIMFSVLVLALAGAAIWLAVRAHDVSADAVRLRADADRQLASARALTSSADGENRAISDPAGTAEVKDQLRSVIENTLSYDYRNLDRTAAAVRDNFTGKATCEYDQLFGEVKRLAPEQKIVLTTTVREIGVLRLDGDQATVLVFVDQSTTRADQNQTTSSGAQFTLAARRQGSSWKISGFDVLGQPLPDGKQVTGC